MTSNIHITKCPGSISTTYTLLRDTSPWYRINQSVLLSKTCINSWYVAGLGFMSWSTKTEKLHYIVKLTVIWTQDVLTFKIHNIPEVMKFYTFHRYLKFSSWICVPWQPIFDSLYYIITLPNTLNGFDTQKVIFLFFYSFLLPYLKYVYVDNR